MIQFLCNPTTPKGNTFNKYSTMRVLLFGAKGWIGGIFKSQTQHTIIEATARADDYTAAEALIAHVKPDSVVSFIGRTHGPGYGTIDYLEQPGKLVENMRDNLYGPLNLAQICQAHNIHYVYLGTGCIYSYTYPGQVFTEEDAPNFFGSAYSTVKGFTDSLIRRYSTTLQLRIRMPITATPNSRNLIDKLLSYPNICSIPNSMTVLDDMMPIIDVMISEKTTGTYNMVNPSIIEHSEILDLYKTHVDPTHTYTLVDYNEQMKFIKSHRSNNTLMCEKLKTFCDTHDLALPTIQTSVLRCIVSRVSNK